MLIDKQVRWLGPNKQKAFTQAYNLLCEYTGSLKHSESCKDMHAKIKYSLNIGDNLGRLHDLEMDFTDRRVRVGGFILAKTDVMIEWYLMKVQNIPHGRCSLDPSCITVKHTSSGFVDFDNPPLTESGLFYLCAIVHQTDILTIPTAYW
jgi:hypothetical protein